MTEQKYKLPPLVGVLLGLNPHVQEAVKAYGEACAATAIAAAPEPVCKWTFVGIGFDSECGWHVKPSHSEYPHDSPYPFCPHCGRKTEVVEYE